MKNNNTKLLPSGFRDLLPVEAEREFAIINLFVSAFQKNGFKLVKPAIAEYENTAEEQKNSFKLFDINTEQNLVFRSDITPQIARIIKSGMLGNKFPLKLCYSGQVLRLKTEDLYKDRQITQLGLEIIGSKENDIISFFKMLVAVLKKLKLDKIIINLNFPYLLKELVEELNLTEEKQQELLRAIKQKNLTGLQNYKKIYSIIENSLFGVAEKTLPPLYKNLSKLKTSGVDFSYDLLDILDYSYDSSLAFTIYGVNHGEREEIGRGGAYFIDDVDKDDSKIPSFGFSISVNNLLRL
ncbi:MAG: ATP phosphoribosyltransferase regulatory subunit [Alphaproteobacteria bacterium]|jgi:ATP phosphoribosyltransferase regulatory subunit HisZ